MCVDPIIHNKFTFIVPHALQKYMLDVYCNILDENTDNFLAILFREKVRPVKILNSSFNISK